MTLELTDLEMLGARAVEDFKASLGQSQEPSQGEVARAAAQLLAKLEFAYGLAARLAHREPTVEGTHAIWATVVTLCDHLAAQLRSPTADDPATRACYDRILDFRNAAERRRALHA